MTRQPKQVPSNKASHSMISILMGSYNGADVLPDQLQSFAAQSHQSWCLICSDDGSDDTSRTEIRNFARSVPQLVELREGPRAGFAANYMTLFRNLDAEPGFLALADQDDIWMPDKLERAYEALTACDPVRPVLYSARRWIWDAQTDHRRLTSLRPRPPGFRNALVENIAPGNTIVLNPAAARLAHEAAMRTGDVFAHDWWLYLLITGAGGHVIVDDGPPCLLYRQHENNAIGGGGTISAQVQRKRAVLQGAFRTRLQGNLAAMHAVRDLLTPENRDIAEAFEVARTAPTLLGRVRKLVQVHPYRQSRLGSFGFWGAALLGRI